MPQQNVILIIHSQDNVLVDWKNSWTVLVTLYLGARTFNPTTCAVSPKIWDTCNPEQLFACSMSAINNLLRRSQKGTMLQTNVPKMWNLACAILIRIPAWLQNLFVVSLLYEADISNFFEPRTQMHDPPLCNMNQTRRYGVLPKSRRTFCLRLNPEFNHFIASIFINTRNYVGGPWEVPGLKTMDSPRGVWQNVTITWQSLLHCG